jgi:hypothetical protein
VADLNADGFLDLVVPDHDASAVSVLLGKGGGTFQPHVDYAVPAGALRSEVADLNGDGKPDLAIAPWNSSNVVSILLGKGDGTFLAPATFPTGASPEHVVAGDFNRDGKMDLAVAANDASAVSVLLHIPISGPNATLSLNSLTFASQLVGTTSPAQSISLTNYGTAALGITGIGFTGANPVDFAETNTCNGSVAPGATCTISVTFKPTGINARSASLSIADNAPGSPQTISLSGVGTLAVSLSNTNLTFANQLVGSSSASQLVTLANGEAQLTISSIAVTGTNATDFSQTNTCGPGVPAGASCTIRVTFMPIHPGPRTASVNITDDAVGSPQMVTLSGTGVAEGPNATLSPTSLTFATQQVGTTSPAQSIILTNYGTVALSITGIGFTGADPGDFAETNTCGSSVAPKANCTINVTFKPTDIYERTASLSITDNAPGSPQATSLSGAGTGPLVDLNPASLLFYFVQPHQSRSGSITLTNVGSKTLSITGITITGSGSNRFSQTNNCDSSVGGGKSCTITVTFYWDFGRYIADLYVSYNGEGSPQHVHLDAFGCDIPTCRL